MTFVDDLDAAPVAEVGAQLEAATEGGVNVEFAYLADGRIDVRTWERGVGETLACGTGAVAVAAVAKDLRFSDHDTVIRLRGGDLTVQLIDDEAWITVRPCTHSPEWWPSRAATAARIQPYRESLPLR